MFKILIALFLLVAIQGRSLGGFSDRPDLIDSPITKVMVELSVNHLANSENKLRVVRIDVLHVSRQIVNGKNYYIVFTAHPSSSDNVLVCTAKVYEPRQGEISVTSVECD
jgi:hypothetical protein